MLKATVLGTYVRNWPIKDGVLQKVYLILLNRIQVIHGHACRSDQLQGSINPTTSITLSISEFIILLSI